MTMDTSEEELTAGIEVVVGTYEHFLVGLRIDGEPDSYRFMEHFINRSHCGSVRCIDIHGHLMATGGADDRIYIFNLKTSKEIQMLDHHKGTVNSVRFTPDGSYLLTGSDDGTICVVKTGSWQLERIWTNAHDSKAILRVVVHASSKFAFTLGADKTIALWDLVKGEMLFYTSAEDRPALNDYFGTIEFNATGTHYAVTGYRAIEVWSIKEDSVQSYSCSHLPICVCWINETTLLIGLDNGDVIICDIKQDRSHQIELLSSRVKDIKFFDEHLATVSSDGFLILYQLKFKEDLSWDFNLRCTVNVGCRPICLAMFNFKQWLPETNVDNEKSSPIKSISSVVTVDSDDDPLVKLIVKRKVVVQQELSVDRTEEHPLANRRKNTVKKKRTSDINKNKLPIVEVPLKNRNKIIPHNLSPDMNGNKLLDDKEPLPIPKQLPLKKQKLRKQKTVDMEIKQILSTNPQQSVPPVTPKRIRPNTPFKNTPTKSPKRDRPISRSKIYQNGFEVEDIDEQDLKTVTRCNGKLKKRRQSTVSVVY